MIKDMDSGKRAKLVSTEMLKPAEACEPKSLHLSGHDKAMRYAGYQKRIVFYRRPATSESFPTIVSSLKESLSRALVPFYPFAGRLVLGTMEIDCSNPSVQFSVGEVEATIDEVDNSSFEPSDFCDGLCEMNTPTWPWSRDFPLLIVQVTEFACGGFSIGFAFSHQISDGPTAWHFFKSWSELSKFGSISNPPVTNFSVKELEMNFETTLRVAETIGYRLARKGQPEPVFLAPDKLRTKRFTVDKQGLARLKTLAQETSRSQRRFSTFQVLAAYFWRQMTIARCLDEDQHLNFFLLMNARDRFGGLPTHYFGNAATSTWVECSARELVQNGFDYGASLLHDSIAGFNQEKCQAEMNFLDYIMSQEPPYLSKIQFEANGFSMVVSSPRYPIFESDFGYGSPVGVTIGTSDLHEGKQYWFPSASQGSIDVIVVLQPDALARLVIDI